MFYVYYYEHLKGCQVISRDLTFVQMYIVKTRFLSLGKGIKHKGQAF